MGRKDPVVRLFFVLYWVLLILTIGLALYKIAFDDESIIRSPILIVIWGVLGATMGLIALLFAHRLQAHWVDLLNARSSSTSSSPQWAVSLYMRYAGSRFACIMWRIFGIAILLFSFVLIRFAVVRIF